VLDSGPGGLVKTAMALLDPTDPLQQALDVDIPGNFFTSLPIPETRASGTEMCSMVAIYTSFETLSWSTTRGVCSGIEIRPEDLTLLRTVYTFGDLLSWYRGTGHGRFTLHNGLEDLSHRIALLVGMNACRQRTDVFSSAINPGRRKALHTAQRKAT